MSSIFAGKTALRHQYEELAYTPVNAATNAATSVLLMTFGQASRMLFIDNTVNVDLSLYLVHPDADSTNTSFRLFWQIIPTSRVLNYNISQAGLSFDPQTKLFVSKAPGAGAATSGAIRVSSWG